jgi:hypothetical protein
VANFFQSATKTNFLSDTGQISDHCYKSQIFFLVRELDSAVQTQEMKIRNPKEVKVLVSGVVLSEVTLDNYLHLWVCLRQKKDLGSDEFQ